MRDWGRTADGRSRYFSIPLEERWVSPQVARGPNQHRLRARIRGSVLGSPLMALTSRSMGRRAEVSRFVLLCFLAVAVFGYSSPVSSASGSSSKLCWGQKPTILGTGEHDTLEGTNGDDVILARGGPDSIEGKGGDDRVCGGGGQDWLRGQGGSDRLAGQGGHDGLEGGVGADVLHTGVGGSASDGPGDDVLVGSSEDDETFVTTSGGRDVIRAGGGESDLDKLIHFDPGGNVSINLRDHFSVSNEETDRIYGIEWVEVPMGAICTIVGNSENNILQGCYSGENTIRGGEGSDSLIGGQFEDVILAGRGSDSVFNDDGNDRLEGGPGRADLIQFRYVDQSVTVDLEQGTSIGPGTDTLAGFENVVGSAFADQIYGNDRRNVIHGYVGSNSISGRDGDDLLIGGMSYSEEPNTIDGGEGVDTCAYPMPGEPGALSCEVAYEDPGSAEAGRLDSYPLDALSHPEDSRFEQGFFQRP